MDQEKRGLKGEELEEKMAELIKTKEELKRARDKAMESWLDSRPLIDDLEQLQARLAGAKNRISMSKVVASEVEAQLEAIHNRIKLRSVGESEANKENIKMTSAVDEVRQVLEEITFETAQEQKAQKKLKQVLKMKRQKLRTTQLTLRAVRIEAEAIAASKEEATQYINSSQTDTSTGVVNMTQEEHLAMIRKAKEESALAEWRVSVSMEQKLAAEASRNLALSKLKDLHLESRVSKKPDSKEEMRGDQVPKARVKAMENVNRGKGVREGKDRSGRGKKRNVVKKKKVIALSRVMGFVVRTLSCTCGEKSHKDSSFDESGARV